MIKTFRGLLKDGAQDRIKLQTIQGKVGYRIVKFQLMFYDAVTSVKSVVVIWKREQTTVAGIVDFTNSEMLAAAMLSGKADQTAYPEDLIVVFDNEIINQDVYIAHSEIAGTAPVNYYLELEAIPLTDQAAEYTTIKDLRSNTATVPA